MRLFTLKRGGFLIIISNCCSRWQIFFFDMGCGWCVWFCLENKNEKDMVAF